MRSIALVLGAAMVALCGCKHTEAFTDAQREISSQDLVIEQLTQRNETLTRTERTLRLQLETLNTEVAALRRGQKSFDQGIADVDQRLRSVEARHASLREQFADLASLGSGAAGPEGVLLKQHPDGVALEVAEILLFNPGSAELAPRGRDLLKEVAQRLAARGDMIRIEGHTDSDPVVKTREKFPRGNLELSGERALVVASFLTTEGGLPAERVSFAGFGEFRPVVANTSPDNMARNRRVEIVLLSPDR